MKEDEIVLACDRYSNETVVLRKHVSKYKHAKMDGKNFSANLTVVALKLIELTQFASPN